MVFLKGHLPRGRRAGLILGLGLLLGLTAQAADYALSGF